MFPTVLSFQFLPIISKYFEELVSSIFALHFYKTIPISSPMIDLYVKRQFYIHDEFSASSISVEGKEFTLRS